MFEQTNCRICCGCRALIYMHKKLMALTVFTTYFQGNMHTPMGKLNEHENSTTDTYT